MARDAIETAITVLGSVNAIRLLTLWDLIGDDDAITVESAVGLVCELSGFLDGDAFRERSGTCFTRAQVYLSS